MTLEVLRRSGNDHAKLRSDPYSDHVLLNALSKPYASIEALGGQINEPLLDRYFHGDLRKFSHQTFHGRHEYRLGGVSTGCDAYRSGGPLTHRAQGIDPAPDVIEGWAQSFGQLFACISRRDIARRSCEQPYAHALFQTAHGMAQRRLRCSELCSRAGKATLLRDSEEGD
jgi:hypothetical protein